jgi:alkylation response protein AidB-like acyl-CoA dehydrogenase
MTHEVVLRVRALSSRLAAAAEETERIGKLADESVKVVREAGVMRLLQPTEHGGYAAHPRDFAEAVMEVASTCGATGWVTGVGGVHPWEIALMDPRLGQEIWGSDQDTWIASPYTPTGIAVPTDGGYRLTGRWSFSSGCDHCDWTFLGALVGNPDGTPAQPPRALHVVLPRSDYTIIEDSWNVFGLSGTGSKDVVVRDAFVPDYRTIDAMEVAEGEAAAQRVGRTEALYRMPFWAMFPLGITAAVIGICEGLLATHLDYQRDRVTAFGTKATKDPHNLYAISEAAAEIAASRLQLLDGISRLYDQAEAGTTISFRDRSLVRRNQVRCAWRAVAAGDAVFARSGGNALRKDNPVQRFWRDAHAGLHHAIHVAGSIYQSDALTSLGAELPPALRAMI